MARSSLSLLLRLAGKLYSHNNPHGIAFFIYTEHTRNELKNTKFMADTLIFSFVLGKVSSKDPI